MWRLWSEWHKIRSSLSVHLGAYAVMAVAAVTVTLAAVDMFASEFPQQGDRLLLAIDRDRSEATARRTLRDDGIEPVRVQGALVDRRGQRVLSSLETASITVAESLSKPVGKPTKISRPAPKQKPASGDDPRTSWYSGGGDTYTTVCVRLCDGSIKPASFSTTEDRFEQDARACQSSCASPSRLYVYRNPGGSVADMEDLSGQAYAKLKTAFLFQTTYVSSCTCRAQPWEQAAADRHRVYALQDKVQKGDKKARAELKSLGPKVAALTVQQPPVAIDTGGGSVKARRQAEAPSQEQYYSRRPSQSVASGSFSGQGTTVMRLGGGGGSSTSSSSKSSSYRPSGSSSRDTGWKGKLFEAR